VFVLPEEDTPVDDLPAEERSLSEFEAESDATPALVEERERKFGRYRLKYQIASGGMASVFLGGAAGPGGFEKPVAIKRMHPHLARRQAYVDMFLDEAQITSRINHPNVCQVFDFGETDGAYFMAMEYLLGEPLTTVLAHVKKGQLFESPVWHAVAARICASIGEGLHAAHELCDNNGRRMEVVHRDVSPSNIIVTFDGGVKVVDFGVAKARGRIHQTTTGTLKGKFSYMAPEQVSGKQVDSRADVWSMGVCLWEMLTCKRLFRRASEMETLMAVGKGPIPEPWVINPAVPEALGRIALKALQRDQSERYQSARNMSRELEAWLRTQEHPAGMSDVADFLSTTLTHEHSSKMLFVQTAMHERSNEVKVAAAETRVLEGTPSQTGSIPPFSDSTSHTRPRIHEEEATGATAGAGPNRTLLFSMAGILLVTLIAAIIGVVLALTGGDSDTESAASTPPEKLIAERPATDTEPTEVENDGREDGERLEAERLQALQAAAEENRLSDSEREELAQFRARAEQAERERAARASNMTQPMGMAAPAARPPGTLMLTGSGARVSIDGQGRGLTPWRGQLSPGRHAITLRKDGRSRRFNVTIITGRTRVEPIGF
jgi:serine/threonine protein kinase